MDAGPARLQRRRAVREVGRAGVRLGDAALHLTGSGGEAAGAGAGRAGGLLGGVEVGGGRSGVAVGEGGLGLGEQPVDAVDAVGEVVRPFRNGRRALAEGRTGGGGVGEAGRSGGELLRADGQLAVRRGRGGGSCLPLLRAGHPGAGARGEVGRAVGVAGGAVRERSDAPGELVYAGRERGGARGWVGGLREAVLQCGQVGCSGAQFLGSLRGRADAGDVVGQRFAQRPAAGGEITGAAGQLRRAGGQVPGPDVEPVGPVRGVGQAVGEGEGAVRGGREAVPGVPDADEEGVDGFGADLLAQRLLHLQHRALAESGREERVRVVVGDVQLRGARRIP